jgi:acyl carrier protein
MKENPCVVIEEKIKHILICELEVDSAILATSSSQTPLLGHGIGLDSVEALVLVTGIEQEFAIEVADADLTVDLFKDIGTLAAYVWQKLAEQKDHSTREVSA